MAAGAFNGAATMADCEAVARWRGPRERHRHNNRMKEEVDFGCPLTISDS
jgi:hypothetical protein